MKLRALALSLSLIATYSLLVSRGFADTGCHGDVSEPDSVTPVVEKTHRLSSIPLAATDGRTLTLSDAIGKNDYLVVTFFSSTCPCQAAHDPRLKDLHSQWYRRGVAFIAVDSEANSSLANDIAEAKRRAYPFPILSDPEGKLADALGAKFATYTVILDREGRIRYRGGIDSDKSHLTEKARHYVRTALSQLLSGQDPNPAEGKTLGCFLRRR